MPLLGFADQTYSRPGFGVPQMRLENMYSEATPSGPGKEARYPRPCLLASYTIGSGPIRCMFQGSGVVGGSIYAVSGSTLYKGSVSVGAVTAGTRAYMDGSNDQLGIVIGGDLYCYDGSTLTQVRWFKANTSAQLTLTGNPTAGEAIAMGTRLYTFRAALVSAYDIKIGATAADSLANLTAAVIGGPGAGTVYGTGTLASTEATATRSGLVMTIVPTTGTNLALFDTLVAGSWNVNPLVGRSPLPEITGITYSASRFYLTVAGTDQWYYSDLDDLTAIDALSFATAESAPDAIVGISKLADEIWFFGGNTVEPWYQTGQSDSPLQRSQGRRFEKGCAAQATIAPTDNTLFFVGNDHLVYRSGQVPTRISTHAIEAAIERCADVSTAFAYVVWFGGHNFYVLTIPGVATYAYDISTRQWAQWTTYQQDTFLPSCVAIVDDVVYLGSATDGQIYTLSPEAQSDAGAVVTFLASAFLPLPLGNLINLSLMLQCSRGLGNVTGTVNPVVEMRYSDDSGQTFCSWRQASLGMQGQFSFKAIWRRLGQINSPGRVYEVRCTDSVPVVFEYLTYNEGQP